MVKLNSATRSGWANAMLIVGILLIATNLRGPITGIGPVLEQIIAHFQLTSSQAGLLTTLPLLAFSIASPVATALASRQGLERSLFIALLLIALGISTRMIDSRVMLYLSTCIIGVGIAIGNVLLPSLIKRDFPHKVAIMTSTYVLTMGIFAGSYSALIIPLAHYQGLGWQIALLCYGIITLCSLIIWLPQLMYHQKTVQMSARPSQQGKIWHHPLAWYITLFLGLNSLFSYILLAWLPSILIEAGQSAQQAGQIHGVFQLASAIPGIVLIPLLATLKDQRILAIGLALLGSVASLGLIYCADWAYWWAIGLGFCSGSVFILGLSFISLRTYHSRQAASLSGMAQCIGYLLAALGPLISGALHSYFGQWNPIMWLCATICLVCAVFGYLSGENTLIADSD